MQACAFMARTGRRSNNFCRHGLAPKSVPTHKNSSSRWNPTPPARHKTPHLPVSFRMSKRKSLWIQNHPQKTPQKMMTHTSSPKCNTQLMQNSILQQQTVPRFLARTRRLQRWENFEMWKNIKKQLIHDLWRKESSGGPQLQKYQHFCMKFLYSIFPFISFYNSIQSSISKIMHFTQHLFWLLHSVSSKIAFLCFYDVIFDDICYLALVTSRLLYLIHSRNRPIFAIMNLPIT